jgi:nitrogen fixation protein FixH
MTTMKIGWGTRIAFLYGGFVLIIAALVIGSMRQNYDLVSKDYYQQELEYQKTIDAGKNQAALSAPVHLHANESNVVLKFPSEFEGKTLAGKIHFYSPVDAAMDKSFELVAENNSMFIRRSELHNATYKVKIGWQVDGKEYYQESAINLK